MKILKTTKMHIDENQKLKSLRLKQFEKLIKLKNLKLKSKLKFKIKIKIKIINPCLKLLLYS